MIDYDEIKEKAFGFVEKKLQQENITNYEIREIKTFDFIKIPLGDYIVEFYERKHSDFYGKVLLKFNIYINEKMIKSGNITLDTDVYKDIVFTTKRIMNGKLINIDDVELKEVNISKYRYTPMYNLDDVIGKISKRTVSAGRMISNNMLDEPYLVKRGSKVEMVYSTNSILLAVSGIAMQDGHRNDIIKIKNSKNKKLQRAKIVSLGKVELNY